MRSLDKVPHHQSIVKSPNLPLAEVGADQVQLAQGRSYSSSPKGRRLREWSFPYHPPLPRWE